MAWLRNPLSFELARTFGTLAKGSYNAKAMLYAVLALILNGVYEFGPLGIGVYLLFHGEFLRAILVPILIYVYIGLFLGLWPLWFLMGWWQEGFLPSLIGCGITAMILLAPNFLMARAMVAASKASKIDEKRQHDADEKTETGSPREDWASISTAIASGLDGVRREWFDVCVAGLENARAGDNPLDTHVTRRILGGDADLAIKAFQLWLTSNFLAQHSYIPPSKGKDFADILYLQICGTAIQEVLVYLNRYHEAKDDGGKQLFRFSSDVARFITDSEAPLTESFVVAQLFSTLVHATHMVVADAFGDRETAETLRSKAADKE